MTVCDPIELFDADSLQDPYPLYNQLRAAGAVGQIGDSEFYAVTSWDAVVEVITRVDEFSSNLTATMVYQPDGTIAPFTMAPYRRSIARTGRRRRPSTRCTPQAAAPSSGGEEDPCAGSLRRRHCRPAMDRWPARWAHRMDGRRGQPAADDRGCPAHRCARSGRRQTYRVGICGHPTARGPGLGRPAHRRGRVRDGARRLHHRSFRAGCRQPAGQLARRPRRRMCRRRIGRRRCFSGS